MMKHTWALFLLLQLVVADIVWTIFAVHTKLATEANPLMSYLVSYNIPVFVLIKLGPVIALTYVLMHRVNEKTAKLWSNVALWGFIALYIIGGLLANSSMISLR